MVGLGALRPRVLSGRGKPIMSLPPRDLARAPLGQPGSGRKARRMTSSGSA